MFGRNRVTVDSPKKYFLKGHLPVLSFTHFCPETLIALRSGSVEPPNAAAVLLTHNSISILAS